MSDNEFKLQREVQDLKAEVRRLRRVIEGGFAVVVLATIMIFPRHLLDLLIFIGVLSIAYSIFCCTRGGQKYEPQQNDGSDSR